MTTSIRRETMTFAPRRGSRASIGCFPGACDVLVDDALIEGLSDARRRDATASDV